MNQTLNLTFLLKYFLINNILYLLLIKNHIFNFYFNQSKNKLFCQVHKSTFLLIIEN